MDAILLGLGCAVGWGSADFFGGLQSRRLPVLAVVKWSQAIGCLTLLGLLVVGRLAPQPHLSGIAWGLVAGACNGLGLALFYRGLALGPMSIVAPIAGSGVVIPVLAGLLMGESLTAVAGGGVAGIVVGVAMLSLTAEERASGSRKGLTVLLAIGAGLAFGVGYVLTDRGASAGATAPLWVVVGSKAGAVLALLPGRRAPRGQGRPSAADLPIIAVIGLLDTAAQVAFAYGVVRGQLGVVATLGSLYPVTTALLGLVVLKERLQLRQSAGVLLAAMGIVLITLG